MRGQTNVPGLLALLVLLAVSAVILYELTGASKPTVEVAPITVTGVGSASTDVKVDIQSATLTCNYNFSNTVQLTITLNGKTVESSSRTGTGTITYDNLASLCGRGTNTLQVSVDNDDRITSLSTTLDIDTYGEKTVGTVESKGSTVFNLLTVLAIVGVAALIIGVVINVFRPEKETLTPF